MRDAPRVGATRSDQGGVSRGNRNAFALAIGSEGETRSDVFTGEIGKVSEDFGLRHAGGEIIQDVRHGDTQPANARLPTALPGFNGNVLLIVHNRTLRPGDPKVKLERVVDKPDGQAALSVGWRVDFINELLTQGTRRLFQHSSGADTRGVLTPSFRGEVHHRTDARRVSKPEAPRLYLPFMALLL